MLIVNAAQIYIGADIQRTRYSAVHHLAHSNWLGPLMSFVYALPLMEQQDYRRVVLVSSVLQEYAYPFAFPYSAHKSGLQHLQVSVAVCVDGNC